jgi:hypothetical protein
MKTVSLVVLVGLLPLGVSCHQAVAERTNPSGGVAQQKEVDPSPDPVPSVRGSAVEVAAGVVSSSAETQSGPASGSPRAISPDDYPVAFPSDEIRLRLLAACPDCSPRGFFVCGDGKNGLSNWESFSRSMFLGIPARSYFLVGDLLDGTLEKIVRGTKNYEEAKEAIGSLLSDATLVAVEKDFTAFRSLGKPSTTKFKMSREFHACLQDTGKVLGCCETKCAEDECCVKNLGAPELLMEWDDPVGGERVVLENVLGSLGDSFRGQRAGGAKQGYVFYCYLTRVATL